MVPALVAGYAHVRPRVHLFLAWLLRRLASKGLTLALGALYDLSGTAARLALGTPEFAGTVARATRNLFVRHLLTPFLITNSTTAPIMGQ
jgi:hypothetical protein